MNDKKFIYEGKIITEREFLDSIKDRGFTRTVISNLWLNFELNRKATE